MCREQSKSTVSIGSTSKSTHDVSTRAVRSISFALRRALREEHSDPRCAYCHSLERLLGLPLEIDHIIPTTVGGRTELTNLCLCCRSCNAYKWQQTHARDPHTGRRVRLFHPRRQQWERHFVWDQNGTRILGTTATGRATIAALRMNNELIVPLRELWTLLHLHPQDMQ